MNFDAVLKQFGPYDRRARLYPALLIFAPLALDCAVLYKDEWSSLTGGLSLLAACGVTYLLGRFARNAGKKCESKLFKKWGGAPTTQLFRHCNSHFDVHTKAGQHAAVKQLFGLTMPTKIEEEANPAAADELYRAATIKLIGATRDIKVAAFSLVFNENVAFGFHRNGFAVRWLGIVTGVASLIWALLFAGVLVLDAPFLTPKAAWSFSVPVVACLAVSVLAILAWLFVLSESAAKLVAFTYAERLLQCCDALTKPQKPTPAPRRTRAPKALDEPK
jgi:hypothetical protein